MAGSGIRGQFEEKFKALIRDIEDEVSYRIDSVVPFYRHSSSPFVEPFRQEMLFASLMKSVSKPAVPSLRKS